MKITEHIEQYLSDQPLFRERRGRSRGFVNLLMDEYPELKSVISNGLLSKETMIAVIEDYASLDRIWRQTLKNKPELRGADYDDREYFEKQEQARLGYNVSVENQSN